MDPRTPTIKYWEANISKVRTVRLHITISQSHHLQWCAQLSYPTPTSGPFSTRHRNGAPYAHFLSATLSSPVWWTLANSGSPETVRWAKGVWQHLSDTVALRAKVTSYHRESGSQPLLSSTKTKYFSFSLCCVEMQMAAFPTISKSHSELWCLTWSYASWQ